MKRFIDDVAVEAIEECVVSKLAGIFSPLSVAMMTESEISRIASETAQIRISRENLQTKLNVLKQGGETCRTFIYKHGHGEESLSHSSAQMDF